MRGVKDTASVLRLVAQTLGVILALAAFFEQGRLTSEIVVVAAGAVIGLGTAALLLEDRARERAQQKEFRESRQS